jgi:hypothetical protein
LIRRSKKLFDFLPDFLSECRWKLGCSESQKAKKSSDQMAKTNALNFSIALLVLSFVFIAPLCDAAVRQLKI